MTGTACGTEPAAPDAIAKPAVSTASDGLDESVKERIRRNREAALAKLRCTKRLREAAVDLTNDTPAPAPKTQRRGGSSAGIASPGEERPHMWHKEDRCSECDVNPAEERLQALFGIRVCAGCKAKTDDYDLITKATAVAEYLVTQGTMNLLRYAAKKNPRHSGFSTMKLFLRRDVKEKALERWGSLDAIEQERRLRDEQRAARAIEKANRAIYRR